MQSQIDVKFSAVSNEGCAPFLVTFINETEADLNYTYLWDFGNGNTSTLKNPKATYALSSLYSVSLTVSGGGETQILTKNDFIVVHDPPSVNFLPNDLINACAPFDVTFSGSVQPESTNDTYLWDFGDGKLSSATNPVHTYNEAGVFNVTLIVEDEYGCLGKVSYENIIKAQKPTAFFEAAIKESCEGELNAQFTNYSYGIGGLSYYWSFGDGQTSESVSTSVSNLYGENGVYNVSLKVVDDLGCKDSLMIENYIEVTNTVASFTVPKDTVCIGENVYFTNNSENNKKSVWDFGDGSTSTEINPQHRFLNSGDYTIKLSIENYECQDVYTKLIHVEEVELDFTASTNYGCQVPLEINYTATSDKAIIYDWRFGNGFTSAEKNPVNTYIATEVLKKNNKESYSDTLIVTSKYGCKTKLIKKNMVNIALPKVTILNDNKTSGCKPISLNFSSSVDYDTPNDHVVGYSWELDGNEVATESIWQNDFIETGTYSVNLTATTNLGCVASNTTIVMVGEGQSPNFSVKNKTTFCASEMVQFNDLTEDKIKIDFSVWEFGDGKTSDFGIPFHFYTDTGSMDVTLKVYHNGCQSSVTKEDVLYINGPIANIERTNVCDNPNSPGFQIELIDADSYVCDFGDGQSISEEGNAFSHTYNETGAYTVALTAYNNSRGCSFTQFNKINVVNAQALFDTISMGPCANTMISFDPQRSQDAVRFQNNNAFNYFLWNFGDSEESFFTDGVISHTYKASGNYLVSLVVKDINNCSDTLTQELSMYSPQVNFSTNYKQGCMPVVFEFADLSESDNPISEWQWDFGDGESSSEQNVSHEYRDFGNYSVSLGVTDNMGCYATHNLSNEINVIFPDVDFKVSDPTSCIDDTLEFSDESESFIESFLWDFGDGVTSELRNPKHTYGVAGQYDLSLKIVDNHGCEALRSKVGFVNIQEPPVAQFVSNVQESNCYPFPVDFQDQSVSPYLGSWKWIFGDNLTGSVLENPKHIYTRPDNYDVTLIAYTTNGCADTITKSGYIYVGGPYAEINMVDSACIYDDISFSLVNKKNLSTILWDFGDGVISDEETVTHTFDRKGVLYPSILLKTNSNFACAKVIRDSIYVDEITADIKFQDNLDKGCVPFEAKIANSSYNASMYKWEANDGFISVEENPSPVFNKDGDYQLSLVAKNDFGCVDTASASITVFPLPEVITSKDTFICKDNDVIIWAEGGIGYQWSPSDGLDNTLISNPIASPSQSTSYAVEVTDENHCKNSELVLVTVQQYPVLDFSDSTIIIGETIDIDLSKPDLKDYLWSPNTGVSCVDCSSVSLAPLESISYDVSVTDTSDCFTMNFPVDITVQKKYSVAVPSAFTPNNDQVNDVIMVKGWGIQELIYFRVFNRTGVLVFESTELQQGWDGKYKGKPQGADVYNFVVRVKTYDNEFLNKKGNIKLIR